MTNSPQVSEQDWGRVETLKERANSYLTEPHLCNITVACCLVELRDRLAALEAAEGVAGNPGHASESPADVAPQVVPTTPAVLTVDELADCLPANARPESGVVRQAFARHLLDHPRIGPLLRGEGAPAKKRVVLPEEPPFWRMPYVEGPGSADDLARAVWAAARAEVERQQQGGQADG